MRRFETGSIPTPPPPLPRPLPSKSPRPPRPAHHAVRKRIASIGRHGYGCSAAALTRKSLRLHRQIGADIDGTPRSQHAPCCQGVRNLDSAASDTIESCRLLPAVNQPASCHQACQTSVRFTHVRYCGHRQTSVGRILDRQVLLSCGKKGYHLRTVDLHIPLVCCAN